MHPHSLRPLEGLSNYENGELLSLMIIRNEAISTRISKDNEPGIVPKKNETQILPNRIDKIRWEFQ